MSVRGLGNPRTFRALKKLVKSRDPDILFLSETKLLVTQLEKIRVQTGMAGCMGVDRAGCAGGLGFFWKEGVDVKLLSFSVGHVDTLVTLPNGRLAQITGFYGNPDASLRDMSWELLRRLNKVPRVPWLVCGDFNEIEKLDEKLGGAPRSDRAMSKFREVLDFCGLKRMPFKGFKFTWENRREGTRNTKLVLDKGYLNNLAWDQFPQVICEHIPVSVSDRQCLCFHLLGVISPMRKGYKRLQFELAWMQDQNCEEIVNKVWERSELNNSVMRLNGLLDQCSTNLM